MLALRLTIENETALPDGGPLSYTLTGRRGIDIGRDKHLDWVLPDPTRYISSKHCEVRFRDGGYWLHDVSSNGTFVNGAAFRLTEPRRLRGGDRLEIGRYIIKVEVEGDGVAEAPDGDAVPPVATGDIWAVDGEAPPAAAGEIRARRNGRPVVSGDLMDWAVDLPGPLGRPEAEPVLPAPRGRHVPVQDTTEDATPMDWAMPGESPSPRPPEPADAAPDAPPPEAARPEPPTPSPTRPAPGLVQSGSPDVFLAAFARGAGLPPDLLGGRDAIALAEELGRLMLLVTTELKILMQARAEAKGAMRSANQTSVQALDNNPIPFAPTAEDALRLMLAGAGPGYLGASAAVARSFEALKAHQLDTFIAMQAAVEALVAQLDPETVDRDATPDRALGQLFASRKARLWDLNLARWQALAAAHDGGLRGAFMSFFAAAYDRRTTGR